MAHGPWGAQAWAHHGPYVRYLIECNHTHDKISDWRGGPKASPQFAEGAIQVDPWRTLTAGIRARSLDELQTPNRSTRRRIRLPWRHQNPHHWATKTRETVKRQMRFCKIVDHSVFFHCLRMADGPFFLFDGSSPSQASTVRSPSVWDYHCFILVPK
jgi:hypothetical protein